MSRFPQTCSAILSALTAGDLGEGSEVEVATSAFKERCHVLFPLAACFGSEQNGEQC